MAPRPLESKEDFIARLSQAALLGKKEVRFGQHHHSHAACREGTAWRVRRLVTPREKAEAFMKQHGSFTPENNEDLAEPADVVLEAPTLHALVEALRRGPWPL